MAGVAGKEVVVEEGGAAAGKEEATMEAAGIPWILLEAAETVVEGGCGLRKEDVRVRKEEPRRRFSGVCGRDRGIKLFKAFFTANAVHGNVQY